MRGWETHILGSGRARLRVWLHFRGGSPSHRSISSEGEKKLAPGEGKMSEVKSLLTSSLVTFVWAEPLWAFSGLGNGWAESQTFFRDSNLMLRGKTRSKFTVEIGNSDLDDGGSKFTRVPVPVTTERRMQHT